MSSDNNTIPSELIHVVKAWLVTKAEIQILKPLYRNIHSNVLKEVKPLYSTDSALGEINKSQGCEGVITNPDHSYLMDKAFHEEFYSKLSQREIEAGYKPKKKGNSYLLEKEALLSTIERSMVELSFYHAGKVIKDGFVKLDIHKKVVDATVSLVCSNVNMSSKNLLS